MWAVRPTLVPLPDEPKFILVTSIHTLLERKKNNNLFLNIIKAKKSYEKTITNTQFGICESKICEPISFPDHCLRFHEIFLKYSNNSKMCINGTN